MRNTKENETNGKEMMKPTQQDIDFVKQVARDMDKGTITTEQAEKAWPIIVAQANGTEGQDVYDSAKQYFM